MDQNSKKKEETVLNDCKNQFMVFENPPLATTMI